MTTRNTHKKKKQETVRQPLSKAPRTSVTEITQYRNEAAFEVEREDKTVHFVLVNTLFFFFHIAFTAEKIHHPFLPLLFPIEALK